MAREFAELRGRRIESWVSLVVGGRPLLLIAGELYETGEDDLEFHRLDESVLAFTDLAAAGRVSWDWPRTGLRVL